MTNFELIDQVRARPQLWQKYSTADAATRTLLWKEVSLQVGWEVDVCRVRWKNLRDAYKKTLRRITEGYPETTWPYYGAMGFIKDILLNAPPKVIDITQKRKKRKEYSFDLLPDEEEEEMRYIVDPLSISIKQESEAPSKEIAHLDEDVKHHPQVVACIEEEEEEDTSPLAKMPCMSADVDEDQQFLLSLLPHFRKVPANRKLPLRMKIEEVIYNEMKKQKK